jgi:hypothetical protein
MLDRLKKAVWVALALLCWDGLHAQTLLLTSTAVFSGSASVVDFNSILTNETTITNQFAGQGVTFGGGLFSLDTSGDTSQFPSNGGGVIASDWKYSQGVPTLPWTATFTGIETRAGFLVEVNSGDSTQITTFLNGTPTGIVSQVSLGTSAVFFGIQDLSGFNSISVTVTGPGNHFIAIDDFRFEAVPEPGTTWLLASGLLAVGLQAWRRRGVTTRQSGL